MISILVPAYNSEKYIGKCLDSIIRQTYKNFEVIVVNDGSTDNTGSILADYAKKDSRIRVLTKENEKSISKTRNYLLEQIKGDFFVFVDSDDEINERFLELLYVTLQDTESDIVCCGFKINSNNSFLRKAIGTVTLNSQDALVSMLFGDKFYAVWNKLIKTSVLHDIRFDNDLNYGEDLVFFINLLNQKVKVTFINNRLYQYKLHKNSLSFSKFSQSNIDFLNRIKEMSNSPKYEKYQELLRVWVYFTAKYYRFLTHHKIKKHMEYRKELKVIIKEYKSYYKNSKIVPLRHRLFMAVLR